MCLISLRVQLAQQASKVFSSLCKYQGRSLWAAVYEDEGGGGGGGGGYVC